MALTTSRAGTGLLAAAAAAALVVWATRPDPPLTFGTPKELVSAVEAAVCDGQAATPTGAAGACFVAGLDAAMGVLRVRAADDQVVEMTWTLKSPTPMTAPVTPTGPLLADVAGHVDDVVAVVLADVDPARAQAAVELLATFLAQGGAEAYYGGPTGDVSLEVAVAADGTVVQLWLSTTP